MIADKLNKKMFQSSKIVIIDVNSVFLFSKNPVKKLNDFISFIESINKDTIFINVIDNGLNRRMTRLFPEYKGNRVTSKENHSISNLNSFNKNNKFKVYINRIHKIDSQFKNRLTFYLTGEADFKIGYILRYISEKTSVDVDNILTVANDKDLVLASIKSNVLLKRQKNKKFYQFYFKNNPNYLNDFKNVFNLNKLNMNSISQYYYYLLLNGDNIDNIKQLLTKSKVIAFLNKIYDIHNTYNLDFIIKHMPDFNDKIEEKDILNNTYLIDIFNNNTFTKQQRLSMDILLHQFLLKNNINVM